ncbi:MAG: DivIVA domain-containing protein [Lachnospiraceae bacterium]|nr:DivIVA domain-containing protein [Lachnospiraceae bacterium]
MLSIITEELKMIKPIDIRTQKFKKGIFGYKTADVDTFVDSVYREYEEVYNDRNKFADDLEKLNSSLQENRLKLFELENQVQKLENDGGADTSDAERRAAEIIREAEAKAAQIIANAERQAGQTSSIFEDEPVVEPIKTEPVKEEPVRESASSRFFKKAEEEVKQAAASNNDDDDDEIFVGEIEDARKPDRMMIGDGEEEEADFEFL